MSCLEGAEAIGDGAGTLVMPSGFIVVLVLDIHEFSVVLSPNVDFDCDGLGERYLGVGNSYLDRFETVGDFSSDILESYGEFRHIEVSSLGIGDVGVGWESYLIESFGEDEFDVGFDLWGIVE